MKKIILGVAGVVVIILIFVSLNREEIVVTEEEKTVVVEENVVVVAEQNDEEETVVSYAKLSKPGYVLIYGQDSNNNKIVVGSSDYLEVGEHTNIKIKHQVKKAMIVGKITVNTVADNGDQSFSSDDEETLSEETEVVVDIEATDPEELTGEEIVELIEDAGYEINEEVEVEFVAEINDDNSSTEEIEDDEMDSSMEDTNNEDDSMMIESETELDAEVQI